MLQKGQKLRLRESNLVLVIVTLQVLSPSQVSYNFSLPRSPNQPQNPSKIDPESLQQFFFIKSRR